MNRLLHITTPEELAAAREQGAYTAPSLQDEGFIHCSTAEQVAATANRYYAAQSGLILLHIDGEALEAELKWEPSGGELFPHIYGPLDLDAIVDVEDFAPGPDGVFVYPLAAQ